MPLIARFILETAAALITLGGLYDLLTARLPTHLLDLCGENPTARKLARELLRALGGSLVAIGLTVLALVVHSATAIHPRTLILVLLLVVPSEGVNSFCMRRVGSPFYVPLAFVGLTLLGVFLAWPR